MKQIPEEGQLFKTVDKNWKEVMRHCVKDPRVKNIYYMIILRQQWKKMEGLSSVYDLNFVGSACHFSAWSFGETTGFK